MAFLVAALQLLCCTVQTCGNIAPSRPSSVCAHIYSLAAAGTPEEASARRWLQVHGSAVKCVRHLSIGEDADGDVPVSGLDAERLSNLLASLPALTAIDVLVLRADLHCRPTQSAIRAFLAGAARAIARCSSLQHLHLYIHLLGGLAGQLPLSLVRELASVRTVEDVTLSIQAGEADRSDWPATFSLAHLVTGLVGLPRLCKLRLVVRRVCMEATLPACVSRLAQLTSLKLDDFDGLRCEPGWARLPALARLKFEDCVFAGDGEDALPGMDTLVSLTSLKVWGCPSLRVLPAPLWQLPQLRFVSHHGRWPRWKVAGVPRGALRGALPAAGMPPGGAPCCASLTHLTLAWRSLRAFPPCILTATRLKHLDLSRCCFGQLPESVSVLTGLEELCLGRHSTGAMALGRLDAQALGSLACFPHLRSLSFLKCGVLFSSDFQAAAAHPRLEELELRMAYPENGLSYVAFLGFVYALLQRGRAGMLCLMDSHVSGAGRRARLNFLAGLEGAGYPLSPREMVDYREHDSLTADGGDVTNDDDGVYSECSSDSV